MTEIVSPTRQMSEKISGEGGIPFAEATSKLHDVVEPALARALMLGAEAARWQLVAQIATELEERRRLRKGSSPPAGDLAERKDSQRRC